MQRTANAFMQSVLKKTIDGNCSKGDLFVETPYDIQSPLGLYKPLARAFFHISYKGQIVINSIDIDDKATVTKNDFRRTAPTLTIVGVSNDSWMSYPVTNQHPSVACLRQLGYQLRPLMND